MGKYEKEFDADKTMFDGIADILLPGPTTTCDITNKETGETARGVGYSRNEAEEDARHNLHKK